MGGCVGGFVGHCVVCGLALIRVGFCVGVGGCLEDSNLERFQVDVLKMELCCVTSLAAGRDMEASRDERTTMEGTRVNRFALQSTNRKMNISNLSYAVYTITTPLRSRAACIPSLSIYVYVPVYPFQVK